MIAEDALCLSERGKYEMPGSCEIVYLNNSINSEIWTSDDLGALAKKQGLSRIYSKIQVGVNRDSIVDTIFGFQGHVDGATVGVLNFASAYHPSGHNDDIACCSDLTFQQLHGCRYYLFNREDRTHLHTDCAIFSRVTFFRKGNFDFVEKPYTVNVLTCPAVNLDEIVDEGGDEKEAVTVMLNRMRKMLHLFAAKGCTTIVLCVWERDGFTPRGLTKIWWKLIDEEKLGQNFERILFSVCESGLKDGTYKFIRHMISESK